MEKIVKDLCFDMGEISQEFRSFAWEKEAPPEARQAWRRLAIDLWDLRQQLYLAKFVANDARVAELAQIIKGAGDEADPVTKVLKEVTEAFTKAREFTQGATSVISQIGDKAKEIKDKLDKIEEILGQFGVELG